MFLPDRSGCPCRVLVVAVLADGQQPYVGGGFGHFYAYAPVKIEYAIEPLYDGDEAAPRTCSTVAWPRASTSPAPINTIADICDLSRGTAGWRNSNQYGAGEFLARARVTERAALDRAALGAAGRQAWAHGQPSLR